MPSFPVTSSFAAVLALLCCVLSVRVLRLRRTLNVRIGDGDNMKLLRAIRVHGNFVEYVPLALLLLLLLEARGIATPWLAVYGTALVVARISHALGVSRVEEVMVFRIIGVSTTLSLLIAASITLLLGNLL
jgi:uncharacterized protein